MHYATTLGWCSCKIKEPESSVALLNPFFLLCSRM